MRHIFFAINFGGIILFLMACVFVTASMDSPVSFWGGLFFLVLTVALGVAEFVAWYGRKRNAEKALGWTYVGLALLTMLVVVANPKSWATDNMFEILVGVFGIVMCVYFLLCGIYRIVLSRR